jgi:hypothetical protein
MAWRFSLKTLRLARSAVYGFGERVLGTSRQAPFRSLCSNIRPVPRLGRYAADVQFKMVRCAFDRDQLVLEHAARVIHLLQAAVDFEMQGLRGGKRSLDARSSYFPRTRSETGTAHPGERLGARSAGLGTGRPPATVRS